MEKSRYSIDVLKEIIAPIAEKYHVSKVYLFGSYARGENNENSDIDLRIEKGELKGMFALCGFYSEIEDALQLKVDIITTGSLEEDFLKKIEKEEVLLYAS